MATFSRPRGDKAQKLQWPDNVLPSSDIYAQMRVGDLIHDEDGYRAAGSYVIGADGALIPIGHTTGRGDGSIPIEVARHIESPLDFYENEIHGAVCEIEFDPVLHAPVLKDVGDSEWVEDKDMPKGMVLWGYGACYLGTREP